MARGDMQLMEILLLLRTVCHKIVLHLVFQREKDGFGKHRSTNWIRIQYNWIELVFITTFFVTNFSRGFPVAPEWFFAYFFSYEGASSQGLICRWRSRTSDTGNARGAFDTPGGANDPRGVKARVYNLTGVTMPIVRSVVRPFVRSSGLQTKRTRIQVYRLSQCTRKREGKSEGGREKEREK